MYLVPQETREAWGTIPKTVVERTLVIVVETVQRAEMVLRAEMVKTPGQQVKVVDTAAMVDVVGTANLEAMVRTRQVLVETVETVHMVQLGVMVLTVVMVEMAFPVTMRETAVTVNGVLMDQIYSLQSDPSILLFTLTKHWYIPK